jgi:hypothetical protein
MKLIMKNSEKMKNKVLILVFCLSYLAVNA